MKGNGRGGEVGVRFGDDDDEEGDGEMSDGGMGGTDRM